MEMSKEKAIEYIGQLQAELKTLKEERGADKAYINALEDRIAKIEERFERQTKDDDDWGWG